MIPIEQVTKERKVAGCLACSVVVAHVQVVTIAASGFKIYSWVPFSHRNKKSAWCEYMTAERRFIWSKP